GDQAVAPPGIGTGQVLVVGAGRRDEEVEPAALELAPGPLQAAGEDLWGKGRLLARDKAEVGSRNAEQVFGHSVPRSAFRVPRLVLPRDRPRHRDKLSLLHRPSSSRRCGLNYPPSSVPGRLVLVAIRGTDLATAGQAC